MPDLQHLHGAGPVRALPRLHRPSGGSPRAAAVMRSGRAWSLHGRLCRAARCSPATAETCLRITLRQHECESPLSQALTPMAMPGMQDIQSATLCWPHLPQGCSMPGAAETTGMQALVLPLRSAPERQHCDSYPAQAQVPARGRQGCLPSPCHPLHAAAAPASPARKHCSSKQGPSRKCSCTRQPRCQRASCFRPLHTNMHSALTLP